MKTLNRKQFDLPKYTTRALQFGEGNFLRGFLDWQIEKLNRTTNLDMGIAVVRPIDSDFPALLNAQDCLYTNIIRGLDENNQPVEETTIISSINTEIPLYQDYDAFLALAEDANIKFIFSNTTEAGIEFNAKDSFSDSPPSTFPAKLTQWLARRYLVLENNNLEGLYIIPCELIDYNGEKLKQVILQYIDLWRLDESFRVWVEQKITFCSTLVDRIVTGHPREELPSLEEKVGYHDQFMVTAEYFYLFVIQGPKDLIKDLKLEGQNLNIKIVEDIKPYKERKVAILNGAHTAMVPVAYMSGLNTVGEAMNCRLISQFVENLIDEEIIPVLSLPKDELSQFAHDVIKRFKNPYIKHQLTSISLNSMAKWKTRILPQLIANTEITGSAPKLMSLAFAAQILFYRGIRNDQAIPLNDQENWLLFFKQSWSDVDNGKLSLNELVEKICANENHWEFNLNALPLFTEQVTGFLQEMLHEGVASVLSKELGA
ncbi:tagaturonate reductase [Photobacterium profundum]|uniref:Hypothetical altronate oxidoreductase n=1 Tax=Photobacterium profundum (strain SS9) TaxID=298386 RepID=Q6LH48_PHOPR|nr:tagaturonate reductase [Photobacterium profundum]CAG23382.1 Hypothetical altronate oxidoreductase [Photobacterium profundum SS9]